MKSKSAAFVLFWLFFPPSPAICAFDSIPADGKAMGMGHAVAAEAIGLESFYFNPAGLVHVDRISFYASFSRLFGIKELDSWGAAGILPIRSARLGLGCHCFGNAAYLESALQACAGMALSKRMAVGIQFRFLGLDVPHYGSTRRGVWDAGFLFQAARRTALGVSIFNGGGQTIGRFSEPLPRVVRTGIGWKPLPTCLCLLECDKEGLFPAQLKAGIEMAVAPVLKIRSGFQTGPLVVTLGFGFSWKNMVLDWGASLHPLLGTTQGMTLAWKL